MFKDAVQKILPCLTGSCYLHTRKASSRHIHAVTRPPVTRCAQCPLPPQELQGAQPPRHPIRERNNHH